MSKDINLAFVVFIFALLFLLSTSVLAESSSSSDRMKNRESSNRDRLSQSDKSYGNQSDKKSSDKHDIHPDDQRGSGSGQQPKIKTNSSSTSYPPGNRTKGSQ